MRCQRLQPSSSPTEGPITGWPCGARSRLLAAAASTQPDTASFGGVDARAHSLATRELANSPQCTMSIPACCNFTHSTCAEAQKSAHNLQRRTPTARLGPECRHERGHHLRFAHGFSAGAAVSAEQRIEKARHRAQRRGIVGLRAAARPTPWVLPADCRHHACVRARSVDGAAAVERRVQPPPALVGVGAVLQALPRCLGRVPARRPRVSAQKNVAQPSEQGRRVALRFFCGTAQGGLVFLGGRAAASTARQGTARK